MTEEEKKFITRFSFGFLWRSIVMTVLIFFMLSVSFFVLSFLGAAIGVSMPNPAQANIYLITGISYVFYLYSGVLAFHWNRRKVQPRLTIESLSGTPYGEPDGFSRSLFLAWPFLWRTCLLTFIIANLLGLAEEYSGIVFETWMNILSLMVNLTIAFFIYNLVMSRLLSRPSGQLFYVIKPTLERLREDASYTAP